MKQDVVMMIILYLLTFAVFLAISFKLKKRLWGESHFDERQLMIRSNAYSTGLYVIIIALVINASLKEFVIGGEWAAPLTETIIILSLGIVASTFQCLITDSYFPQHFNQRRYVWFYCVIIIIQFINGISQMTHEGNFDELGRLNNVGLVAGCLLLVLLVIGIISHVMESRRGDEE